jgi:uncharacterized protein
VDDGEQERVEGPDATASAGGGQPLSAAELPALLDRVHAALTVQRERLDELNVFPVPDGDTGTNMTLTVRAGLEALRDGDHADARAAARAVTRGAMRGARGNSGVILSQVIRAVVDVVLGHEVVDADLYAAALARCRELAYEAVANPIEGTILTVITAAAEEAASAAAEGADLVATSDRVCTVAHDAVAATRDQLEVLRDAGVVDAGARGFEVLLAAVHAHLTGQAPEAAEDHPDVPSGPFQEDTCHGSLQFRYEVQYLLEADDDSAPVLRQRLELLGDSVVVVAAGGLLNVHVHTDDIGAAIEEGVRFGSPSDIAVTNFADQIAERRADAPLATVGAVAVVSGSGALQLTRSLGAVPVDGAAGTLPSVADLLNASGEVRASTVVLLPGHPNAVATARQASEVAVAEGGRPLEVVERATSLPAVLAALAVLDPAAPADRVLDDLTAAASAVRHGEVVTAIRDAETPVGTVQRGQPLAIVGGEVVAIAGDALAALGSVCTTLDLAGAELVTLLLGADAPGAEREHAEALVRSLAGDAEVEVVATEQRGTRYAVGAE